LEHLVECETSLVPRNREALNVPPEHGGKIDGEKRMEPPCECEHKESGKSDSAYRKHPSAGKCTPSAPVASATSTLWFKRSMTSREMAPRMARTASARKQPLASFTRSCSATREESARPIASATGTRRSTITMSLNGRSGTTKKHRLQGLSRSREGVSGSFQPDTRVDPLPQQGASRWPC